jgi:hypothetical protein
MVMRILTPLVCCTLLLSCQLSKRTVRPDRKWAPALLQEDLKVMQSLLEAFHPSLYAYLPREEWMEACVTFGNGIKDSLTTHQFLYGTVLPLISTIRCGHTQARYPKRLADQIRRHPPGFFPLQLTCWSDTLMVVGHLNPADSLVPRGSLLTAIDGLGTREIRDAMFRFMPADGYALNFNNHRLSTSFPALHRNIFGLRPTYRIGIRTPGGKDTTFVLPAFRPDTSRPAGRRPLGNMTGKPLRYYHDTLSGAAVLHVQTFDKRFGVRRFYRKSFRDIRRRGTRDLIIDIRNNGGGYVDQEAQVARYLLREPFRVADTAAAVARRMGAHRSYFHRSLDDRLVLNLLTRRQADGKYHLRYWERRVFQPRRRNAFRGRTFVLISGPTFSAASLFAGQMKGRENIFLLGEETGGAAYANNGLLLPECRLPNTRIRLTIPLFRIVPNGKVPNTGRGVEPDIRVEPDAESVRMGIDRKFERVRKYILENPAGQ